MTLNVHSMFVSISGEVGLFPQGSTCHFIRLAGCNLKCSYCDTEVTQDPGSGKETPISDIVNQILGRGLKRVLITGGEPLLQTKGLKELTDQLSSEGILVQIETNGSLIPDCEINADCFVVDYKLLGSGKTSLRYPPGWMSADDYLKFVCHTEEDIEEANAVIKKILTTTQPSMRPKIAIGTTGKISPKKLWLTLDPSFDDDVILNVQIHKLVKLD